jgi:hypothetical protein
MRAAKVVTNEAVAAERGRRPRFWRRSLAALAVIVAAFAAATARVIVWPAQGMPPHVDAIVMMAGGGDRVSVALRLARERRAPVLVISRSRDNAGPCPAVPGVKIFCFVPDPRNTRGEAEFASRLAKRYGWRSVVLVTTAEQDTRARLIMRRCYGGSVYAVIAPLPWTQLPYQIAYGWGALFKALFLVRDC